MADPNPTPPQPQDNAPAKDMSQYIRTYAKDVAQLTNQPIPATPPKPQPQEEERVKLPEVDASPVNRPEGNIQDVPKKHLNLLEEDSEGIFEHPKVATPPPPPPAPVTPTPPPPPPPPPQPSVDLEAQKREEVLARLREKVAAYQSQAPAAPTPPPPPPAPPVPPPTPEPKPVFSPFPPAPPKPVAPEPPPPSIPPIGVVPVDSGPSPLHTYTSDFSKRIDEKDASTFTVLAEQSDAGMRTTTVKKKSALLPVVLAVLLIIVGMGGLFAAYRFMSMQEEPEFALGVPSLILADEKMELNGPNYRQDLVDAASQPLVEGNILITYVTSASTTALGLQNAPQPGGALIRLLNLGAPDIIFRNVDLSSTVGVVAAGGETSPFFIFRVNSYERTFAGMLAWESRMLADFDPLYPLHSIPTPEPVGTTTPGAAVSAAAAASEFFRDAVVANVDVRILKDSAGRTLLLYGYSDQETLIIARNEAAFTTLVARLNATRGGE